MFSIFRFVLRRLSDSLRYRPVTVEYPFVTKPVPQSSRTRLKNTLSECTGCLDCSEICPTTAIIIKAEPFPYTVGLPKTSKGVTFERSVESFQIDYSRCVLCGLCVQACETQALTFDRKILSPKLSLPALNLDLVHIPRSMRKGQVP